MAFPNIMFDLETMSTSTDAAIVSIGAVRFDLNTGEIGDKFYRVVNLKSSQRAGGAISADSVIWWTEQSKEAQDVFLSEDAQLIEVVLKDFNSWIREHPLETVWCHGVQFDIVIIEGAYARINWTPAWSCDHIRDYRTLKKLFPEVTTDEFIGIRHNALDDSINQAKHLSKIWQHLVLKD